MAAGRHPAALTRLPDKLSQLIADALENSPNAEDAQQRLARSVHPRIGRIFQEVKPGNAMVARRPRWPDPEGAPE